MNVLALWLLLPGVYLCVCVYMSDFQFYRYYSLNGATIYIFFFDDDCHDNPDYDDDDDDVEFFFLLFKNHYRIQKVEKE